MSQDLTAKREEIPDADDADQSSTFEHPYMPDVMAVHQVEHLGNIVVRTTRDDLCGHEFRDRDFERGRAMLDERLQDVALREHPDSCVPLRPYDIFHHQSTNILSSEEANRHVHGLIHPDHNDARAFFYHNVLHLHGISPVINVEAFWVFLEQLLCRLDRERSCKPSWTLSSTSLSG